MRRLAAVASVLLLAVSACGGGDSSVEKDLRSEDLFEADDAASDVRLAETAIEETVDFVPLPFDAVEVADLLEEIETEPGSPGSPCEDGGECNSGFCIVTPEGKQCTLTCEEECPFGWECAQYAPALPDVLFICAPRMLDLCRPCVSNDECVTDIDTGQACVAYGPEGAFCGEPCEGGDDCPPGYGCEAGQDVYGAEVKQCVADGGCACTARAVDQGATTDCYATNDFGTCYGVRSCLAVGLTACDAAMPAAESCNDVDDDCDGQVDEGLAGQECLVENPFGNCPGTTLCIDGNLLCDGPDPSVETCNGEDDDCDGETDEGFADTDDDGIADCMENDKDGDGLADGQDNCPGIFNPTQVDHDFDNFGDACDADDDNDKVPDTLDCAPFDDEVNPDAEEVCDGKDNDCNYLVDEGFIDTDFDGWRDCVDEDDDNDGAPDGLDCAPLDAAAGPGKPEVCDGKDNDCDGSVDEEFGDLDGDGAKDCVDPDVDGDGVANGADNCPVAANPGQEDADQDGVGDGCDKDADGDSIPDALDNCPGLMNPGQSDVDGDKVGDACDDDVDGDGAGNEADNCPLVGNPGQEDLDGDGVGDACEQDKDGDGTLDGADCAPLDPQVHPGAEEVCDGKDNDCNYVVDEGFADTDGDGWKDCLDGDDDNDGTVDGEDCAPLDGALHPGATELCDGIDNDCDQEVDEELGSLACGKGECFHTVAACIAGVKQTCDPFAGIAEEVCDGKDNDCDGLTDEDQGKVSCGLGLCFHTVPACAGGEPAVCEPLEGASVEVCDGLDNDCDGKTDEGLGTVSCGKGQCFHQLTACVGGEVQECNPFQGAMPEVCDGVDNDCDGEKDEELGTVLCGTGACEHEQDYCVAGKVAVCNPFAGAQPEVCDLEDNDCDGLVDEDLGVSACGEGECAHAVANCVDGVPGECNPQEGATDEVCDGKDNDCDGTVDEDFADTDGDETADCMDTDDDADGDLDESDCAPTDPAISHFADEVCGNDVDDDCDGEADPYDVCLRKSCFELHQDFPELPSGGYTIDPDGEGGVDPIEVGCDMTTDGGGWTLVMALRGDTSNNWHLYDYEAAGFKVPDVPDQVTGDVQTICALPKAFINALGEGGQKQYLVDIGKGLFKLTMTTTAMDWYRGIYQTSYSNGYVSTIVQALGVHVPTASPAWAGTDNSMLTRSDCPGGYCHYIPDDVSGGSQWAHRHNTTPAAGSPGGGTHYSKVFLR